MTKDDTTIVEGGGSSEDVKGRVAQIKREIEDTDSDWDREKLQERLAKLAGGVAVVKVGAATEVELKEKKHRIEDALSATRAAVEEGIVAGGGTALIRARKSVNELADTLEGDEATGARIVARALEEPLRWIAFNAGLEGAVLVSQVEAAKGNNGLNAATGEIEDLVKAGIIDPAKVTRSALQNAASIAGLLLTTEALVADKPEKAGRRRRGCRRHGRHGRHGWHGRDDVASRTFCRTRGGTVSTLSGFVAGPSGPAAARPGVGDSPLRGRRARRRGSWRSAPTAWARERRRSAAPVAGAARRGRRRGRGGPTTVRTWEKPAARQRLWSASIVGTYQLPKSVRSELPAWNCSSTSLSRPCRCTASVSITATSLVTARTRSRQVSGSFMWYSTPR